jgi:hypothetical protein
VEALQGPHLPSLPEREGNIVNGTSHSGPARCFYLTIHFGQGESSPCQAPVRWHGVIRTADGTAHRVLSCDAHAEHLDDRKPVTRRVDAVNTTTDRVVMLSPK